jgi:ribonuclease P protein component
VHLEADIPASFAEAPSDPWFSHSYEDGQRTQGPQEAARQGSEPPDRLAKPGPDERLRTRQDFQRLFTSSSRSLRGSYVVLLIRGNGLDSARCAFVASKRIGGAVVRNRCRRIMREAYRVLRPHVALSGWDIALIARPPCRDARSRQIVEDLAPLYREAGLMEAPPAPAPEPKPGVA